MRRSAAPFRSFGLWLVACALALRLVVAPGFMPVATADGVTIAMCSGQGAVTLHLAGKSDPAMPAGGGCAFAALAVATAPDVSPAIVRSEALPLAPELRVVLLRSPYVGVPAPPPPALGPPALI